MKFTHQLHIFACLSFFVTTSQALSAEDSSGIPVGEKVRMSAHAVDATKMQFRPGKGLQISSADELFSLTTRLRAQMLYTLEQEDNDLAHGFQLRRARLAFNGHMFDKGNTFKFELAVSPKDIGLKSDGSVSKSPLLDWYFHFKQLRDLNIRVGQYKIPYSHQRVVSSGNLQFVDRSIANGEFNLDRDLGFDLRSKDLFGLGFLRYYAGIYMGEGHSSYANGDMGMMYLGRLEVLPFGMFKDYSETAFKRSSKIKLKLGIAGAYLEQAKKNKGIVGSVPVDGGTTDTMNANADMILRYSGLSLEGAFFWREGTRNPGVESSVMETELPRNGTGYYAQTGFLLPNNPIELSARFGQIMSGGADSSLSNNSEAGASLSYYFAHHAMKIQADYFRFWNGDAIDAGSDQVRIQMQMSY
jgi:hypothetical protein